MIRGVSGTSRAAFNLNSSASDTKSNDGLSLRSRHGSQVGVGEARSETWKKRRSSITFSKFSTLNPDVFNEPRLSRVSTMKASVSSHEGNDGVSRSSYGGNSNGNVQDTMYNSYASGLERVADRHKLFRVPNFFDGVNETIWWRLVFENDELEQLYQNSEEHSARTLFRMACAFLILACLIHATYYGVSMPTVPHAAVIALCLYALLVAVFLATSFQARLHGRWERVVCKALAVSLVGAALATLSSSYPSFSTIGRFSLTTVVVTVLYVFLPLDLPVAAGLGWCFSLLFEFIQEYLLSTTPSATVVVMKLILHLCLHVVLASVSLMSEVFRRNTFWRIGRSLLHQEQLDFELALKEKMIHSVMPEVIASELLEIDDNAYQSIFRHETSRFRPLMLHRMDSVTILFADIVGFTKMSSTKTASALVALLNNLFNRFDKLAEHHGCEKISTLGDCYYCVAGCPAPCANHADRCVHMGVSMCRAIQLFCTETGEDVNMRVGIHTGTVLCGIVGVHRFKFDVFSNDVQLANQMESGGVPGMVHISQATFDELTEPQRYLIRDGDGGSRNEQLRDITTYLISPEDPVLHIKRSSSEPSIEPLHPRFIRRMTGSLHQQQQHQNHHQHPPATAKNAIQRKWIESTNAMILNLPQKDGAPRCLSTRSLLRGTTSLDEAAPVQPLAGSSAFLSDQASVSLSNGTSISGGAPARMSVAGDSLCSTAAAISVTNSPAAGTIGDLLKERETYAAPHVKVRLSELAATDLLRIAADPLETEKGRQEVARKARVEEQRLVINILNNNWDRLVEQKKISARDLSMWSLVFVEKGLEALHRLQFNTPTGVTQHTTFDSPIFTYFLQVAIMCVVFLLLSAVFFVMFSSSLGSTWIAVFAAALCFYAAVALSVGSVCYVKYPRVARMVRPVVCNWWVAHLIVGVLLSTPIGLVVISWPCAVSTAPDTESLTFHFFVLQVSLTFCLLFTQLHCAFKGAVLASACAGLLAFMLQPCGAWSCMDAGSLIGSSSVNATAACSELITRSVYSETFLIFAFYLLLILLLNRQYEAASRLNFKSQVLAQVSFEEIQQLKEQADSLLSNLLPDHVSQQLKVSPSYSEDHELVGVIFASVVNFSDFYSEHFEGGIGCIRVLNELISDFDDLLCKPQFASVEKIKTIGATYMAASGLNASPWHSHGRYDRSHHLKALLQFALQMQQTVQEFNENMVGYEFVLRIGFNCGPVTAGVVGSTKLLYDIWGNTVNVASRMDSTGVPGRIQVPDECVGRLQACVAFTQRADTVFVKGKGDMVTHLVDNIIRPNHHQRSLIQNTTSHLAVNPAVIVSGSPTGSDDTGTRTMLFHRNSIAADDQLSVSSLKSRIEPPPRLLSTITIATHFESEMKHSYSLNRLDSLTVCGVDAEPVQNAPIGSRHTRFSSSSGRLSASSGRISSAGGNHGIPDERTKQPVVKTFSLPTNAGQRIAMRLSPGAS